MLVDQKGTHKVVRQIVFKVTADRALHEDLTQEAIIHLWLREAQVPGQTRSWYFQSCRFFLQNYLRAGRSVDSTRHHRATCELAEAYECPGTSADESVSGGSLRGLVSAREAVSLLAKWLTTAERQILGLLVEGYGVREIGARLGMSHTSVIRYRRRIAILASRLGFHPMDERPAGNGRMKISLKLQTNLEQRGLTQRP